MDEQQRGNTLNSDQDGLHLGTDPVSVELGLLVKTGIEPSHLVHILYVLHQRISPLPVLEHWFHQQSKGERHCHNRTINRLFSATPATPGHCQLQRKCNND